MYCMHKNATHIKRAETYRLVFIDRVLDTASVLGHPWGVKYGYTRHAQYRRRQSEVDTGWGDLKQKKQSTKWLKRCAKLNIMPYNSLN